MIQQPARMLEYSESGTVAEVVRFDDAPDECLIFHHSATSTERVTVWIAAQDGSFVSLDEMR